MKTLGFLLLLAVSTSGLLLKQLNSKSMEDEKTFGRDWFRFIQHKSIYCNEYKEIVQQTTAEPHKHWGYKNTRETYDPEDWAHHDQECGLNRQSPVLLQCSKYKRSAGAIKFYIKGKSTEAKVVNNGHSLVVSISTSKKRPLRMKGGPLKGEYIAEQFHFHWGSRASVRRGLGSEHRVNRFSTISELHIVTFNSKYGTFGKAAKESDGLAVFGVLFRKRPSKNSPVFMGNVKLNKLIKKDSSVKIPASVNVARGLLKALKKAKVTQHYFTYSGSLTTPPCSQVVQWIVSRRIVGLPKGMLSAMQKLKDGSGAPLVNNFRPLQKLSGRKIVCT